MTPLLGASADRLVEYGWPFYFVALPWILSTVVNLRGSRTLGMLLLHLLTCWLGWLGFWHPASYLLAGVAVFALNAVAYALIRRPWIAREGNTLP
jgi:hypothetical protein